MVWHTCFDEYGDLPSRMNHELVEMQAVEHLDDIELLKTMIERHYERTGSRRAQELSVLGKKPCPSSGKSLPGTCPGTPTRCPRYTTTSGA